MITDEPQDGTQAEPSHAKARAPGPRRVLIAGLAVIAAAVVVLGVLAVTGTFSPGTLTVHGTLENDSTISLDGTSPDNMWTPDGGGRCDDSETIDVMATVGGRSVQVASGPVAASGYQTGDTSFGYCTSVFTVRDVPGGYASYGFQVQGIPGTVNMTREQVAKGVGLDIGGNGS